VQVQLLVDVLFSAPHAASSSYNLFERASKGSGCHCGGGGTSSGDGDCWMAAV